MAAPVSFSRWFGPAKSAFSATAAKVDPHLLMPEGAVLLVCHAADDEVRSAVAVPVRHAKAGDPVDIVVGDEQLRRAELRLPLRADGAAPVHSATPLTTPAAEDQVRQAAPGP